MIAIDTNLLVYAHWPSMRQHTQATEIIERAASAEGGWGIPFPCVAEFWSIVTHPHTTVRPSTRHEAGAFLKNLLHAGAVPLEPKAGVAERLVALATDLKLASPRIFDLQIALIAAEAGAQEIWTNDRGFPQIPGLTVRHPI